MDVTVAVRQVRLLANRSSTVNTEHNNTNNIDNIKYRDLSSADKQPQAINYLLAVGRTGTGQKE